MGKKYLETKNNSLESSVLGVWKTAIEEGDARMDVESGWLGLKTSQMGGNETRNQFVDRVRGVLRDYSNQDADVEIASFSYTS